MSGRDAQVRRTTSHGGGVATLTLDGPPANVIASSTCAELSDEMARAAGEGGLRLLVLRGEGRHFSYGASLAEHLPAAAPGMLAALHRVVRELVAFPLPTLAAVSGRCLGGGFELALACGMIAAEEDATFAAPEIRLGVFAPAASVLLEGRVPGAVAEEWLLLGRDVTAREAATRGLVSALTPSGGLDAVVSETFERHLAGRSPRGLRAATRAAREARLSQLDGRLHAMEQLYAEALLAHEDGSEGVRAFLEKREPRWEQVTA